MADTNEKAAPGAHTPGPWELRPDAMGGLSALIYPQGGEYPVASVTGYHSSAGQRLPNARLIASAPTLLSLLKEGRNDLAIAASSWNQSEDTQVGDFDRDRVLDLIKRVNSAIAHAERGAA